MPLWDFRRESTSPATGANTVAGIKAGKQASLVAGLGLGHAEKRNVIITEKGWVRREHRGSVNGGTRKIEQVLVAANPGVSNKDYGSNNYLGNPDIAQIYVKLNANGYISANATGANLYVVFNTAINRRASGNNCTILLANTVGGNHAVANFANTVAQGRIVNANNTLVFRLPPLQGGAGSVAATYQVNAQSITVSGNPLYNPEKGITYAANLVITGAVANTLSRGDGVKVTTFQVRRNG